MFIMEARLTNLKQTLLGLQKTGVPLIQFDGTNFLHSFTADDIGIYVLIPKLANLLGISVEIATSIFFYSLIIIPGLIGILGFLKYFSLPSQKIIAIVSVLLLIRQSLHIGDVYTAYFSSIIAIIPWFLYFTKKGKYTKSVCLFSFVTGFFISFLGYIRAYSGLGVILFIGAFFLLKHVFTKKELMNLSFLFLLGFIIPSFYFTLEYNKSVIYAKTHLKTNIGKRMHTFWHPLYLGFGLLSYGNKENIKYDDYFAFGKVDQLEPGVELYSASYENVLKNEVMNLIKNHWQFVIFTLFAKIGILLFYLLKYANIGLIASFFYRKPWYLEVPFWIGSSFYALFPILTMPTFIEYVLGFITFVTLYGMISINYAIECGLLSSLLELICNARCLVSYKIMKWNSK